MRPIKCANYVEQIPRMIKLTHMQPIISIKVYTLQVCK